MDYQKIKYFLKAAETLNFSEAARQLYITPQSFGKQIALLEQEMGFALFERSTRQTRLTAAGKIAYDHLLDRVQDLEREYEKMCEMGAKRERQIRIGVFNALSRQKVIFPIVNSVLANYPDRDISIRMCDMSDLKKDTAAGQLDLCLTVTHDTESGWGDIEQIRMLTVPARIVVSKYHEWYVRDQVTVEDMKKCNFIKMFMPDVRPEDAFENIPCKDTLTVDNYETMSLLMDQGECFTVMSSELNSYCEGEGKTFPLPEMKFDFHLALVYNRDNAHPFLKELCQFIQEEFEL